MEHTIPQLSFAQAVRAWEWEQSPGVALGGKQGNQWLTLDATPCTAAEVNKAWGAAAQEDGRGMPLYLGLLPYQAQLGWQASPAERWLRVDAALRWTPQSPAAELLVTRGGDQAALRQRIERWRAGSLRDQQGSSPGLALLPKTTDARYLEQVHEVLRAIRDGRYYQLNLLRYFVVPTLQDRRDLLPRWLSFAGPYGCWWRERGLELISFSPERFVAINGDGIRTFPVKGTRSDESDTDLLQAAKDQAELAMIVDLMRHDLAGVCKKGTVNVARKPYLLRTETVTHLQAEVSGTLGGSCVLFDVLKQLLPTGSITGTPKAEVIKAIGELEQRSRGYFMGNVCLVQPSTQQFDSSVLIRTLVHAEEEWEYAAGSGLVLSSIPEDELAEIAIKCRVLTHPLPSPD